MRLSQVDKTYSQLEQGGLTAAAPPAGALLSGWLAAM